LFVGRTEELALLRRRLASARDGMGSLVLVGGAAGIGKTRLVEEFAAEIEGVDVAWGAALDDAGMPALWPWTRALRRLPGPRAALVSGTEQAARIEWGSALEASAAWFAAFTTVVDELAEHALARSGMLIVLEDVHWADGPTVRLLERVVTEVRRLPILVVATHRDVIGGPLAGALPRLAAGAGTEVVRLAPLEAEEAAALLLDAVERADPSAVRDAVQGSGRQSVVSAYVGPGRSPTTTRGKGPRGHWCRARVSPARVCGPPHGRAASGRGGRDLERVRR